MRKVIKISLDINKFNLNIRKKALFYDLNKSLSLDDIKRYVSYYPDLHLDNLDLEHINTNTYKGITLNRTNIKAYPTDKLFLNKNNFDILQESELAINSPTLSIHESKDKLWDFIITDYYIGWVKKKDIMYVINYDILNSKKFIIITKAKLIIDDLIFDMGDKIPYLKEDKNYYYGLLINKLVKIPKIDSHLGYLNYNKDNVIKLALKYLDIPYSWGSKKGIDCSSFVRNIYRVFGIYFPRNTADQVKSIGKRIKFNLNILKKIDLCLLYMKGHVILYLGNNYIIHANATDKKVALGNILEYPYLGKIEDIVLIV